MRAKDAVGRYGEDVAARHLTEAGLVVLARNWRCREGEIDIVARDGDVLVVCEVKTRREHGVRHTARGGDGPQGATAARARAASGSPTAASTRGRSASTSSRCSPAAAGRASSTTCGG